MIILILFEVLKTDFKNLVLQKVGYLRWFYCVPVDDVGSAAWEGVGRRLPEHVAHVAARDNQQLTPAHPHPEHVARGVGLTRGIR